jgi:hypothetical protein
MAPAYDWLRLSTSRLVMALSRSSCGSEPLELRLSLPHFLLVLLSLSSRSFSHLLAESSVFSLVTQILTNANDSTRDIGNSPATILLSCGLDPLSGPQAIELAMRTSSGPHKGGAKGMKSIILIKDKSISLQVLETHLWPLPCCRFTRTQPVTYVSTIIPLLTMRRLRTRYLVVTSFATSMWQATAA